MNYNKIYFALTCLIISGNSILAAQLEYGKNNILKTEQFIHENSNKIITNNNAKTGITKSHVINIHENSIKIANFIVHENISKSKYTKGIDKIRIPDQKKVWTAAASQATLLFNPSAKERDKAINKLITNGGWYRVAKKLLSSSNSKARISGIQILKSTLEHPKYNIISQKKKIKKISPILLNTLNDDNLKVRFFSAIILNNLFGNKFGYNYNSNKQNRIKSIALLTNYLRNNFNL